MFSVEVRILGRVGYSQAWDLQKELVAKRKANEIDNTLILLEHNPVFTIGRNGSKANLLASDEMLEKVGAQVYEVDRGGDITYHGPGSAGHKITPGVNSKLFIRDASYRITLYYAVHQGKNIQRPSIFR